MLVRVNPVRGSTQDGGSLLCARSVADERVNVVANLPYNITKSVLRQMLPLGDSFSHLHFMLQVRVAACAKACRFVASDAVVPLLL